MAWFRETTAGAVAVLACVGLLLAPAAGVAAGPPAIEASWVTGVTASSVEFHAEIDPNGFPTTFHFEYIDDAAFQANPPDKRFLGAIQTAEEALEKEAFERRQLLPSNTTFHYRTVASNSAGTTAEEPGHIFVTKGFGKPFDLPDDRAWEMVSPVDKNGGAIAFPEALFGGGNLQAAAVAAAVTYGSGTAFGDAAGAPPASQYVSRRTASGWSTENVSPPVESGAYGDTPDGVPYRVFSEDLARALLFGGLACRGGLAGCPAPNPPLPGSGAPADYMAFYLRDNGAGSYASLLSAADVAQSPIAPPLLELAFAAASPDLSTVVLSSCAKLTADATEVPAGPDRCDPGSPNLYAWSPSGLDLVNVRPGELVGAPGAEIAAPIGAVSGDGSRVYWSEGGDLYLSEGSESVQLDETLGGGGTFETAAADGAIGFFTRAGHLYRYDAVAKALSDLTSEGGVVGVLGASADGEFVYYQDGAGLQRWHDGATALLAKGADATLPSDYSPATATARVSADGLHIAFLSKARLTGFDNVDANTKLPDAELYVHGPAVAAGETELICASCNPTGERPQGPTSIPGALVNGSTRAYRPRVLSADGSRLFFETEDELSGNDTNGRPDVYEWQANGTHGCQRQFGCVGPISNGSLHGARFVDASADGRDVYFLTSDALVEADPGSIDLYDARENGGFPEPGLPHCLGDACQSIPGEPDDPTPGTLVPNPGNPPLRVFAPKAKHGKKRHKRRAGGKRKHGRGSHGQKGGR